ncbi:hypothetical protein P7C71_g4627, partial [Lecanoromycetidae sp. Uapishka_2]
MSHDHHGHGNSGHSHDDHGHDHGHDHSDEVEPAVQTLIWKQIDFNNIRTLNESEPNAGARIVKKAYQQRLHADPELVSDSDEQLLMFVPFAGQLKLHAILIRADTSDSCPHTLKVYHNRDDLDFGTASDLSPTQTLTVSQTNDVQELQVKRAKFGNTYNLTLFMEDNYGDDVTRVYWIGFKGEFTELNREPFEVLYEKAANPKDHELIAGIGEKGAMSGGRHGM